MSPASSVGWPELNTLGWIRLAQFSEDLNTRIEDFDERRVAIAVPFGPNGEPLPSPNAGTEFFVSWNLDRALLEVPVSLVEIKQSNQVPTWVCEAVGQPTEIQRRNYVRVAADFNVTLDLYEVSAPIVASTLDLSEGGLRLSVDRWAMDPGLRCFDVELPLPEGALEVKCQVVWWGNLDADGQRTVGLRFVDIEPKTADTVRRQVFAMQLEQRRQR